MAQNDENGGIPVLRSVGERRGPREDPAMHGIGLGMAAVMAVVLLPLLPFVALLWLVTSGAAALRRAVTGGTGADVDEHADTGRGGAPHGRGGRRGAR